MQTDKYESVCVCVCVFSDTKRIQTEEKERRYA